MTEAKDDNQVFEAQNAGIFGKSSSPPKPVPPANPIPNDFGIRVYAPSKKPAGYPDRFWGTAFAPKLVGWISTMEGSGDCTYLGLVGFDAPNGRGGKYSCVGFLVGVPVASIGAFAMMFSPNLPSNQLAAFFSIAHENQIPLVHHHSQIPADTSHVFAVGFGSDDKEALRMNIPEHIELEHFEQHEDEKLKQRLAEFSDIGTNNIT